MATIALSGNDTLIINDRVFADFADGNCVELKFPNKIAALKTGKNGNTIYGLNTSGRQAELTVRVIRGSADDKFLNELENTQNGNFEGTPTLAGQFVKKLGDGLGNVTSDIYDLTNGVFTDIPGAKTNVEGDTEQSVAIYVMMFAIAPRAIT